MTCLARLRATKRASGAQYRATNAEKVAATNKAWHQRNPEYLWTRHLKRSYGLTPEEYAARVAAHSGVCDTCGGPPVGPGSDNGRFHLDHCHERGVNRGFLCGNCNVTLGLVKESIETLETMIEYLKFWRAQEVA